MQAWVPSSSCPCVEMLTHLGIASEGALCRATPSGPSDAREGKHANDFFGKCLLTEDGVEACAKSVEDPPSDSSSHDIPLNYKA